ncbi:aldose 1-epimerase family protein [Lactobacillus sp. DCY120]|uniref:Aldose 1-epimerase family protein n=1 Tax=Bombilactobacillus apium TaxID=2675299 RepID=A0A850R4L3_9LACO|nr:aldose 1-epimerase family protein [Bombilactobacillus apium]NVY95777.1 aldose 1-epimerase family protein [Bombilactobacillus apium]
MTKVELHNSQLTVQVETLGAELQSVVDHHQKERIWGAKKEVWGRHAPVLFPIVGRLQANQYQWQGQSFTMTQHGFARDQEFTVTRQTATQVSLRLKANSQTLAQYPFQFSLVISYVLRANSVYVTYNIQNQDQQPLIFGIGGHPGFNFDYQKPQAQLLIKYPQQVQKLSLDDSGLVDPYQPELFQSDSVAFRQQSFVNDAWIYQNRAQNVFTLAYAGQPQVSLVTTAPYLGVWSAYPQTDQFVCIEPWWGIADTVDSDGQLTDKFGMQTLQPAQLFNASWGVTFY